MDPEATEPTKLDIAESPLDSPDIQPYCAQWRNFDGNQDGERSQIKLSECSMPVAGTNARCARCTVIRQICALYDTESAPKGLFVESASMLVSRHSSQGNTWLCVHMWPDVPFEQREPTFDVVLQAVEGLANPWDLVGQLPSAASPAALDVVRDWIDTCSVSHDKCRTAIDTPLPTRVIDVGGPDQNVVKLFETQGSRGQYICLSYCWGKEPFTRTLRSNLEAYKSGIKISDLCQTFQDVVHVARDLGVQYIWIDALCIIQEDAADWDAEAARMAPYYTNACLTIAGSWAESATQGLFAPEPAKVRVGSVDVAISSEHFRSVASTSYQPAGAAAIDFPLFTRAWCYQERLLSPRVLHFARNELIWECRTHMTCQCQQVQIPYYSTPKPQFYDSVSRYSNNITEGSEETWRRVVHEYTTLNLSFIDDRLPAVGGLADEMAASLATAGVEAHYLAGLWRETLINDLCWYSPTGCQLNPQPSSPPGPYRAPTWSWASIAGPVENNVKVHSYGVDEPGFQTEYASVVRAECTAAGAAATGRVFDGFAELECYLVPASFVLRADGPDWEGRELERHPVRTPMMDLQWFTDWRRWVEPMVQGRYYVIPMYSHDTGSYETFNGLVVERHSESESPNGGDENENVPVMTRVGFAMRRYERWPKAMEGYTKRTVRLI